MRKLVLTSIVIVLLALLQTAHAATAITGTVTAKRENTVQMKFELHETAGPTVGDNVEFSTSIKDIKVNAGMGSVTKVEVGTVWVDISKGHPNLKMTGIIQATGKPMPVEYLLDVEHFRFQAKKKWYRAGGAIIKLKLPPGLEFENWDSRDYSADFPDGSDLDIVTAHQGWESTPLKQHHQQQREIKFENRVGHACKTIWEDREITGVAATCIASRAQCVNSSVPPAYDYFKLFASCKAAYFPNSNDLVEQYYTVFLTDIYERKNTSTPDKAEKGFMNALHTLSIKIKE